MSDPKGFLTSFGGSSFSWYHSEESRDKEFRSSLC